MVHYKTAFARESQKRMCCTYVHKIYYLIPEYAVPLCVASNVSKKELRKKMESKMTQLKQKLASIKPVHAESKPEPCSLVNS